MRKSPFKWNRILEDSAEIMAQSIASGNPVSTIPALYRLLEQKYKAEGKALPVERTYRGKLHKLLDIPYNQRNVTSSLYQLAGKYDEMTLAMLSENVMVSYDIKECDCHWLFVKVSSKRNKKSMEIQKHLYHLAHKLKKDFQKEIVYISFDSDTIIILCENFYSLKNLMNYFRTHEVDYM